MGGRDALNVSLHTRRHEATLGAPSMIQGSCINCFAITHRPYKVINALMSSSRHLRGKTMTKQSRCTDLYAPRTVLANEQPPFDL